MKLKTIVTQHQQAFKEKVVQTLAAKYSMSLERVVEEHGSVIERYIQEKYKGVARAVSKILEFKRPVVLNIRRDPCNDTVCVICERDQPNIEELQRLYGDRVVFYEIYDSSSEGALYHIIHQGEGEKLLPLTAVIHKGDVKKYWSGRPVGVEEYRKYLDVLV
ncbi:hypothetical protein DRN97_01275 [Methanosarcinales archaeon]|nr:MAG: hypothetical protein DRN97_01275 [Methanosarcinales archaeon]